MYIFLYHFRQIIEIYIIIIVYITNYNKGDDNMFEATILQGLKETTNKLKIIDAIYIPTKKISERKYSDDVLYVIYRNTKTGKIHLQTIVKPESDIYFVRPEYRDAYKRQRSFLPEPKCLRVPVRYKNIRNIIINEIKEYNPNSKLMRIIQSAYANGEWRMLNQVHKWRYVMSSDYNLVDHAILHWNLEMKPDILPLAKMYLDIESDVLTRFDGETHVMEREELENGEAPINAVTLIFNHKPGLVETEYTVYTFLLDNSDLYPQQPEFKNSLDSFIDNCHREFDDKYHRAKYNIQFFTSELSLIAAVFKTIHEYKSDIGLIWNMAYDIPQFSMRIQHFNYKPEDFFTHPDFKKGKSFYYRDSEKEGKTMMGKDAIANKSIYLNHTGYTKIMDQMVNYAAFRKGGHDYGGNSLDNVSYIELKAAKRKFKEMNTTVLNAAVREYYNFVLYNINDVWLQVGIDEKTKDTDKAFNLSQDSPMSLNKVHKTTHLLINNITKNLLSYDELEKNSPRFIIGNNLNR